MTREAGATPARQRLLDSLLVGLRREGVPHGYWLFRIEESLAAMREYERLLHDLRDAIIEQQADAAPPEH